MLTVGAEIEKKPLLFFYYPNLLHCIHSTFFNLKYFVYKHMPQSLYLQMFIPYELCKNKQYAGNKTKQHS